MNQFQGRDLLVVGLGTSGFSTARALSELGAKVRVTEGSTSRAIEERANALRTMGIEVEIGGHELDRLDAEIAVVSPGVPPTSDIVAALTAAGIRIVSEVEIAYRLARCEFLAVTGTNGKTTTTSLLAAMLSEAGIPTAAAGNIGYPLIDAISAVSDDGAIAVEVSSFQLAMTEQFRPRVAVLLNVAEDHTDWHGSFEDYVDAKSLIVANQRPDDIFVFNVDDEHARSVADKAPSRRVPFSGSRLPDNHAGAGVTDGHLIWRRTKLLSVEDIPLPGVAGLEDAAAAAAAALEYGADQRAVARALRGFSSLPHRLEVVAVAGGITYIDDSKATNPHATLAAVKGMDDVVLIAGGRSKGIDLSVLKTIVPPVVAVVALGEAAPELARVLDPLVPFERAASMDEAVSKARALAQPGGSVLLSPACASLDMFESYAARGEAFVRAVEEGLEDAGEGE